MSPSISKLLKFPIHLIFNNMQSRNTPPSFSRKMSPTTHLRVLVPSTSKRSQSCLEFIINNTICITHEDMRSNISVEFVHNRAACKKDQISHINLAVSLTYVEDYVRNLLASSNVCPSFLLLFHPLIRESSVKSDSNHDKHNGG